MGHLAPQHSMLKPGISTCLCELTLPETEPATSKGTLQAHVLQALKTPFDLNFAQAGS